MKAKLIWKFITCREFRHMYIWMGKFFTRQKAINILHNQILDKERLSLQKPYKTNI